MTATLRIGAVSYLNTKPLVHRLDEFAPDARLSFDLPSRLADQLAQGELDVALIPAVEYFRQPDYTIVSDACIACRGPVLSVKLFSRVPIAQIKSLALDEGSRTSATMVQVLLAEHCGIRPAITALPIGKGLAHADADAVLLIGDRAIHAGDDSFVACWDLGEVWCRRTELPFVFAMWTARPGVDLSEVGGWLTRARDAGLAELSEIAGCEAKKVQMAPRSCLVYLRDNLYFRLGPREQLGLQTFYDRAATMGLVPNGRELRFFDCQSV